MEWIKVSDREPPKDETAFLGISYGSIDVFTYDCFSMVYLDYYHKQKNNALSHWMPLPEHLKNRR
jgi:hypothetical protein